MKTIKYSISIKITIYYNGIYININNLKSIYGQYKENKTKQELIKKVLQEEIPFDNVDIKYRNDDDFMLKVIGEVGFTSIGMTDFISNNKSIMMKALDNFFISPAIIRHCSDELKNDKDLMQKALSISSNAIIYVVQDLLKDREFLEFYEKNTNNAPLTGKKARLILTKLKMLF